MNSRLPPEAIINRATRQGDRTPSTLNLVQVQGGTDNKGRDILDCFVSMCDCFTLPGLRTITTLSLFTTSRLSSRKYHGYKTKASSWYGSHNSYPRLATEKRSQHTMTRYSLIREQMIHSPSRLPLSTNPATPKAKARFSKLQIHPPETSDKENTPTQENANESEDANRKDSCSPRFRSTLCKVETPASTSHPHYSHPFIAPACTVGSLTHRLSGCGHLIVTDTLELCARNCTINNNPGQLLVPNTKNLDRPFVCPVCVTRIVHARSQYQFLEAMELIGTSFCTSMDAKRTDGRKAAAVMVKISDGEKLVAALRLMGKACTAVLNDELLTWPPKMERGHDQETRIKYRSRMLKDRYGRSIDDVQMVKLLQEGRLIRLPRKKKKSPEYCP